MCEFFVENKKRGVAIDVSRLSQDHRGMGFFLREFLSQLSRVARESDQFCLISDYKLQETFPFAHKRPEDLDSTWLVWFPFNHPTFKPKGDYVVTIHDLAPFVFPNGESRLRKKYWSGAENAKKIVVDSQFTFEELKKYLNIHEKRICVISPGFNPDWREEETFNPSWPYLMAVGPAEPRKNFHKLLLAFKKMKEENLPHKLVIAGELPPWRKTIGPFQFYEKNPLPALVKKLKIESEVIFPGKVSRSTLHGLYKSASLVVVPSLYEGFGFPILEAYSCGAPLACSQTASIPEVAGDGAFYFNPARPDDMAAVTAHALKDENAVLLKKKFAEQQLLKFSWNQCIKKYLDLFEKACATV